jgi:hypothetical protein
MARLDQAGWRVTAAELARICTRRAQLTVQAYAEGRVPDLIEAIAQEIARAKLEPRARVARRRARRTT